MRNNCKMQFFASTHYTSSSLLVSYCVRDGIYGCAQFSQTYAAVSSLVLLSSFINLATYIINIIAWT